MTSRKTIELEDLLRNYSPLHFVGVSGSGMRPLAEFTASFGCAVSGGDRVAQGRETSKISFALEGSTLEKELIGRAKTMVISSAISPDHPSLGLAQELGLKTLHRSELLAIFTEYFRTITVAGTHGKTTTSAMIAHILQFNGADPSWVIGAEFADGLPSFKRGGSDILVVEADESDGSFLRYHPQIAVINNVEPDHMDYYETFERLKDAFRKYISLPPASGAVIYFAQDPVIKDLLGSARCDTVGFGSSPVSDFELVSMSVRGLDVDIEFRQKSSQTQEMFTLPLPGTHNAHNALASIAACTRLGFMLKQCARALERFPGVKRRLQRYPNKNGYLVIDDYAHNPGKVQSCITGLRSSFPDRKIFVVFQPHRYSRVSSLYQAFVSSFQFSNIAVIVTPVYAAGEAHVEGYTAETIARDISQTSHVQTFSVNSLNQAIDLVKSKVSSPRDIVLSIGAGDVWKVANALSDTL